MEITLIQFIKKIIELCKLIIDVDNISNKYIFVFRKLNTLYNIILRYYLAQSRKACSKNALYKKQKI